MNRHYEVIIVGGGPAGLTAGLYTTRARINTLLIEGRLLGGQIVNTERIENYPGFPNGISGFELGQLMHQQATNYGLETIFTEVTALKLNDAKNILTTNEGDFTADALIIAGGSEHQKLGVPGEDKLTGKGVSSCATCDGPLFKDEVVAVIGGGDAAITEALALTKFASSVKVIHRRDQLRASKIIQERAFAQPKLEFLWHTVVTEILGDTAVKQLKLEQLKTGDRYTLDVTGVFVAIGFIPNTRYLKETLALDETGQIITNHLMQTNIASIFAAGDIRHNSPRQVITAAGDGATAALSAEEFLTQLRRK